MKWKLAIIVCLYVIGVSFIAAWQIKAEDRILNPPDGILNLNPIYWLWKTGFAFIWIGTIALLLLILHKIELFWKKFLKGRKKSGGDMGKNSN